MVGLCGIEGRRRERRRWLYGHPRVIDLRPGQPLCYLLDLLIWLVGLYEYVGTKSGTYLEQEKSYQMMLRPIRLL